MPESNILVIKEISLQRSSLRTLRGYIGMELGKCCSFQSNFVTRILRNICIAAFRF